MITITEILGTASDPQIASRLHELEHAQKVEILVLPQGDMQRRRFRARTDKGTDIAIALGPHQQLCDGTVLGLEDGRAIIVRSEALQWLRITTRDLDAAFEAGYYAGNHHWRVRFEPGALLVAIEGPKEHYMSPFEHLVKSNRLSVSNNE